MGLGEMIVAIVLITAVSNVLKAKAEQGSGSSAVSEARLQEVLRLMREEMAQLRKESQEVILSFDSSFQRLDARVEHLERQALQSGSPREALGSVEIGNRAR